MFQGDTYTKIAFEIQLSPRRRGMPMRLRFWAGFIELDGEFGVELLDGDDLLVCTDEDDLAAPYVAMRPFEPNKASSRNILFIPMLAYPITGAGHGLSALPLTLRDTVAVVSMLGLEYMSIDALCIKQDDPADKELEIARMSLYYGRNTVTQFPLHQQQLARKGF
ncbi:hypothetical protein GQX73_g8071 [Xylaria multiplex]|uniref:Heterokaryon incompatibility domain-containing protein n=1 Tax=Xylaria multiplex TaxID=323545 RepID=A0A7C8IJU0_9PEZI|nr:hypothetical protein GQX73_g8071 [Xylaria multiplex]